MITGWAMGTREFISLFSQLLRRFENFHNKELKKKEKERERERGKERKRKEEGGRTYFPNISITFFFFFWISSNFSVLPMLGKALFSKLPLSPCQR